MVFLPWIISLILKHILANHLLIWNSWEFWEIYWLCLSRSFWSGSWQISCCISSSSSIPYHHLCVLSTVSILCRDHYLSRRTLLFIFAWWTFLHPPVSCMCIASLFTCLTNVMSFMSRKRYLTDYNRRGVYCKSGLNKGFVFLSWKITVGGGQLGPKWQLQHHQYSGSFSSVWAGKKIGVGDHAKGHILKFS